LEATKPWHLIQSLHATGIQDVTEEGFNQKFFRLLKSLAHALKRNWLLIVLGLAVGAAAVFGWWMLSVYSKIFPGPFPTGDERSHWGAMGDFFGGLLNPVFSLLGLVLLLVTLIQNHKELELSRAELKASSAALTSQANTLEKQRFEDTFFALLDQLNRTLERALAAQVSYDSDGRAKSNESAVDSLKDKLIGGMYHAIFEQLGTLREAKRELLSHSPVVNQYFRILYQVLKYVAVSAPGTTLKEFTAPNLEATRASSSEKFYSNIVRAFVPENVYYLLAVNCWSEDRHDTYYPYKLLVERYGFFEHMILSVQKHQNRTLIEEMTRHFSIDAFGTNPHFAASGVRASAAARTDDAEHIGSELADQAVRADRAEVLHLLWAMWVGGLIAGVVTYLVTR
jgi:uncharacterized membrane protein